MELIEPGGGILDEAPTNKVTGNTILNTLSAASALELIDRPPNTMYKNLLSTYSTELCHGVEQARRFDSSCKIDKF